METRNMKDFIHYYIGQKVKNPYNAEREIIGDLKGIIQDFAVIRNYDVFGDPWSELTYVGFDKIRLILRPLESMTEEEMKGLLISTTPKDMEDAPGPEDYDLEMFYNDGGTMVDGDVAVGCNFNCICFEGQIAIRQNGDIDFFDENERAHLVNQTSAFHYLLQKGFDIFGLIPSGLAIANNNKD